MMRKGLILKQDFIALHVPPDNDLNSPTNELASVEQHASVDEHREGEDNISIASPPEQQAESSKANVVSSTNNRRRKVCT